MRAPGAAQAPRSITFGALGALSVFELITAVANSSRDVDVLGAVSVHAASRAATSAGGSPTGIDGAAAMAAAVGGISSQTGVNSLHGDQHCTIFGEISQKSRFPFVCALFFDKQILRPQQATNGTKVGPHVPTQGRGEGLPDLDDDLDGEDGTEGEELQLKLKEHDDIARLRGLRYTF